MQTWMTNTQNWYAKYIKIWHGCVSACRRYCWDVLKQWGGSLFCFLLDFQASPGLGKMIGNETLNVKLRVWVLTLMIPRLPFSEISCHAAHNGLALHKLERHASSQQLYHITCHTWCILWIDLNKCIIWFFRINYTILYDCWLYLHTLLYSLRHLHLLFHDWVLDTMRRVAAQTFIESLEPWDAMEVFPHIRCWSLISPLAMQAMYTGGSTGHQTTVEEVPRSSKGNLWSALQCVKALYHHLAIFTSPVNPLDSAVAVSRLRCVKCTGSMLSSDLVLVAGPISGIAAVLRRRARTFGVILCNTMTRRYSFQNSMVSIPMCFAGLDKFVMIVKRSDMKTFSQRRTFILYKDLKGTYVLGAHFGFFVKLWDMWFLTWNGPDNNKLRENQVAQRPESLCMRSASVFSISRGPYEIWYLETRFFLVFSVRKFRIIVPLHKRSWLDAARLSRLKAFP